MTDDVPTNSAVGEAVAYLRSRLPFRPRIGIVLGSGLGNYADRPPIHLSVAYKDIPEFPSCSVEGHKGRLLLTDRCGLPMAILQGRVHRYEGYSLEEVTRPIRVLAGLGVEILILTCAAGGLGKVSVGTLMVVQDHLNLIGDNPLIGIDREKGKGSGLLEMADAYDPELIRVAQQVAAGNGIACEGGVLACVSGPTYETPAEAAMLRYLGAQAVCMSTVPEVIVARSLNIRVLAVALITNEAGVPIEGPLSHHQVLAKAECQGEMIGGMLDGVLNRLAIGFEKTLE